jgi:hypothetical protein
MKPVCVFAELLAGILLASCARHPGTVLREPQAGVVHTVNLATLSHGSLLETGRVYSAQVKRETTDGRISWWVQNPPMPPHYAVGFEWLDLSNVNTPREGLWTFVLKDIERWHHSSQGGEMGTFMASYKCNVLKIEDSRK